MFITYRVHYGKHDHPTDYEPDTYSGIAVFANELAGLRYANAHELKLIEILAGETLEEAIQRSNAPHTPRYPIAEQVK